MMMATVIQITNQSIIPQRRWEVVPTIILHYVCSRLSGLER